MRFAIHGDSFLVRMRNEFKHPFLFKVKLLWQVRMQTL